MKINGFYLFLFLFLSTILLAIIYPPFRYFRYLLPVVPVVLFSKYKHPVTIDKAILKYYLTFLIFYTVLIVYLATTNIIFSEISQRFLPNALFVLSPLLFIIFILPFFDSKKTEQYVKFMFWYSIVIYAIEVRLNLSDIFSTLESIAKAHLPSEIATESELGFVFGFFVLYFIIQRSNKLYILLSVIFFILSFKRIVIAGVIVSILTYWLINFFKIDVSRNRIKLTIIVVVINVLVILSAQRLVSGEFDQFILEKTGLSTDAFLLGRKTFYTEVFERFGFFNWEGLGFGKVDDALYSFLGYPMNLHSELIKNYLEFGIIFFIIWLCMLGYNHLFSNKAAIFFIYFNILILTDNIFIYFHGMVYFYFFILIFLHDKKQSTLTDETKYYR